MNKVLAIQALQLVGMELRTLSYLNVTPTVNLSEMCAYTKYQEGFVTEKI